MLLVENIRKLQKTVHELFSVFVKVANGEYWEEYGDGF